MKSVKSMKLISKVVFFLTLVILVSCSDDNVPEGARFVNVPDNLITSYDGVLQYTINSVPQVTESNATATLSKTGDKTYKVTFSDGVPEIKGLQFIENNGTFASAAGNGSTEGVSLRTNNLSVGVTNNDKQWQFSSN
ncbi:hypothetical protein [Tenacibaculum agarivorans]|uniref:hypothetical protein n=1 Tax=Tenacibaculum agarivorans TaxID=1908389 RepID=UPI000B0D1EA3|nr:hypothetical protein [Tenacibaculum agarivorans]